MTKTEVAKLLTFCAVVDKRTVGEADVEAWHMLLGPLDFERCQEAVITHYRRSSDYLTPAAIWQQAKTGTDGDKASALERSLELECPDGSFCRKCKAVHMPDGPCLGLADVRDIRALTAGLFSRGPAGKPVEATEPELSAPDAAALEAERRRQLDALATLTEETA